VCVCQTKPVVNIPAKQNREIPSDTLWIPLVFTNLTSCHPLASPVAGQVNALSQLLHRHATHDMTKRNPLTSTSTLSEILRAHPIKPYQAWTPSSEMQVLPKSMLFTGLPLFNSWGATAWICTKRGKHLQKTTSKQGGYHQHLTLNQQDFQQESTGHTVCHTGLLSNANSCILAT